MTEQFTDITDQKDMGKGEKAYNWLVYTGVNYWGNLALSLTINDYFTNFSGKKYLNQIIDATAHGLTKTKIVNAAHGVKISEGIWKTLALTSGGIIASLATKPLEDKKRPIVHWLNKKLGEKELAPDGRELTPDEIHIAHEQPHTTWWNVIKRRIFSSIAIVGSGVVIDHAVGLDNIRGFVVGNTNKVLKSGVIPGGEKLVKENGTFQRYLGFAALDFMFTKIHAVIMHATNGARHAKMPKEIDNTKDPKGVDKEDQIIVHPAATQKSFVAAENLRAANTPDYAVAL